MGAEASCQEMTRGSCATIGTSHRPRLPGPAVLDLEGYRKSYCSTADLERTPSPCSSRTTCPGDLEKVEVTSSSGEEDESEGFVPCCEEAHVEAVLSGLPHEKWQLLESSFFVGRCAEAFLEHDQCHHGCLHGERLAEALHMALPPTLLDSRPGGDEVAALAAAFREGKGQQISAREFRKFCRCAVAMQAQGYFGPARCSASAPGTPDMAPDSEDGAGEEGSPAVVASVSEPQGGRCRKLGCRRLPTAPAPGGHAAAQLLKEMHDISTGPDARALLGRAPAAPAACRSLHARAAGGHPRCRGERPSPFACRKGHF